jgi:RNA polymerase sigma factor FliA
VTAHLYLVQHIVHQLASGYPRHVDRSELWSAGALGLVDASRRYDPSAGIPFARYAAIRIRGAIIDSTRTRDWASRGVRRGARAISAATDQFLDEHGRRPNQTELAATLGLDIAELEARQAAAASATLLHLDQTGATDDDSNLSDRVEERAPELLPDDALEQRELAGTVRTSVRYLPEIQREVVERYYFQGDLLRDIAESLGVTEARVSQIRTEALNAMRAYFGSAYEGVPEVGADAPGVRRRAEYVATLASHSTWRSRLDAADRAQPVTARSVVA